MGIFRKFQRALKNRKGQSTTEYILILAVVVMIALKFKDKIGGVISGATDNINQDINKIFQNNN